MGCLWHPMQRDRGLSMEPDPDPQDPKASRACAATGSGPQGAKGKHESNGVGAIFLLSPGSQPLETVLLSQHREEETKSPHRRGEAPADTNPTHSNPNKVTFFKCLLQTSKIKYPNEKAMKKTIHRFNKNCYKERCTKVRFHQSVFHQLS